MGTSLCTTGATFTGSGGRAVALGDSLHPALNPAAATTSSHPTMRTIELVGMERIWGLVRLGHVWGVEIESLPRPAKGSRTFMRFPLRRCRARVLGIVLAAV